MEQGAGGNAGIEAARPYLCWHDLEKRPVFVPGLNGEARKRVYIGQDEGKVKEALAGIERGEAYLKLEEKAEWLQRQSQLAGYHCMNLLDYLGDGVNSFSGQR